MSCDRHVTESRSSNLNSNQHCHVGERTGARDGCDIPCHAYTAQACLSDTAVRSNRETCPTFGPEVATIKTTLIFRDTFKFFCSSQSLIVNQKISRIERKLTENMFSIMFQRLKIIKSVIDINSESVLEQFQAPGNKSQSGDSADTVCHRRTFRSYSRSPCSRSLEIYTLQLHS